MGNQKGFFFKKGLASMGFTLGGVGESLMLQATVPVNVFDATCIEAMGPTLGKIASPNLLTPLVG